MFYTSAAGLFSFITDVLYNSELFRLKMLSTYLVPSECRLMLRIHWDIDLYAGSDRINLIGAIGIECNKYIWN